ncbi:MAG: nucleotidyltransferase family protein, partial [Spirosomaceae bacterium]|nr:nucleotidyltransferase family protein [Spirosomataceae bacterium]
DCRKFNTIDKSFEENPADSLIDIALNASGQYEISFVNNDFLHIDFHWGLYYGYLPFSIDFESFFQEKQPTPETLFWMLLLHQGGKENWVRMKHFADLIAFLNRFQSELDWDKIFKTAKEYKLHKQLIVGFRLLGKHFDYPISESIGTELLRYPSTEKIELLIEKYWDKSEHWSTLFPRLRMERIFVKIQDESFSKWGYFSGFYKTYTKPNPLEQPRIFNFPENYPTLNFLSKVLTYLVRKF